MPHRPTYYAGQTVGASFVFRSFARTPPTEVIASFGHERDVDDVICLTGVPRPEGDNHYRVDLGEEITVDDTLGLYRCVALEVVYGGGRKVAFRGVAGLDFRIEEENILPPEPASDWLWNKD